MLAFPSAVPVLAASLLMLLPLSPPVFAAEASAWAEGHSSRARLIAGGDAGGGSERLAGVDIALAAGYKTYWRHPGESGLPPAFDWAGSNNLGQVELLWPAPERFEDASGVSYGYHDGVVFPFRVAPRDPSRPIQLRLKVDYGVCKEICIPARAELELTVPALPTSPHRAAIEDALARVPRPTVLGEAGDLAILSVDVAAADGSLRPTVSFKAPAGTAPRLFVEAPANWYVAAREHPLPAAAPAGTGRFVLDILERPREPEATVELRLTLAAGERAIEATASLDTAKLPR